MFTQCDNPALLIIKSAPLSKLHPNILGYTVEFLDMNTHSIRAPVNKVGN